MRIYQLVAAATLLLSLQACSQRPESRVDPSGPLVADKESDVSDSLHVMEIVEQFHMALAAGDSAEVAQLLAPDAVILESGVLETKSEYLSHHFHSDAAFLGATTIETVTQRFARAGEVAWISSTNRIHGTFRGRDVDLDSAELLVLRRARERWRIVAIHWSSASRKQ